MSLKLTASMLKQLNMIGVVNDPFMCVQAVAKSSQAGLALYSAVNQFGGKEVFIHREYDGSERCWFLFPSGRNPKQTLDDFLKLVESVNKETKGGIVVL